MRLGEGFSVDVRHAAFMRDAVMRPARYWNHNLLFACLRVCSSIHLACSGVMLISSTSAYARSSERLISWHPSLYKFVNGSGASGRVIEGVKYWLNPGDIVSTAAFGTTDISLRRNSCRSSPARLGTWRGAFLWGVDVTSGANLPLSVDSIAFSSRARLVFADVKSISLTGAYCTSRTAAGSN